MSVYLFGVIQTATANVVCWTVLRSGASDIRDRLDSRDSRTLGSIYGHQKRPLPGRAGGKKQCEYRHGTRCRRNAQFHVFPTNGEGGIDVCREHAWHYAKPGMQMRTL